MDRSRDVAPPKREPGFLDHIQTSSAALRQLRFQANDYPTLFVDQLLELARLTSMSDLHLQPSAAGIEIRIRQDGVLHLLGEFMDGKVVSIASRLKVLSNLLTYRSDVPQEGRIAVCGPCCVRIRKSS